MRNRWLQKNNLLHIEREFLKTKFAIKFEIKKKILKNIRSNHIVKPITRALASYKLSHMLQQASVSKQKSICLITGRSKGVYKLSNLSRHTMKKLFTRNNLQNIQINNW